MRDKKKTPEASKVPGLRSLLDEADAGRKPKAKRRDAAGDEKDLDLDAAWGSR